MDKTILMTFKVHLDMDEGTDLQDFLAEFNYDIYSDTEGIKVEATEVIDHEEIEDD